MVKGLNTFQKYFAEYENQYVLIGGAAYGLNNGEVVSVLKRVFS